ncbi:glycosyltransferase family 2 protein [Parapedobacter tibetensis]|uniref:glycosyltransferase family 2 protein n=1 Tax=Parapedobacter tibetensis TaxID=2972951 RepID=UPI00214DE088|nr:glycosyltransferase family 2 protein [Parapedobacter tibetensis]
MEKGISVIICSHNGGSYLKETLSFLNNQVVPSNLKWELIFVDNASTDNIGQLVKEEWKAEVPLCILIEQTKGKYYALQKGIQAAKYCYFVICDDDNFLQPDYLAIAFEIMESDEQIGALGGLSLPAIEGQSPLPSWFDRVKEHYAIGQQNPFNGIVQAKHLWGAGLCSRTKLYNDLYAHYPSLLIDRHLDAKLIAEDTEYCLRLQLIGYTLYYSDQLLLYHYLPSNRLNNDYLKRLMYNRDVSFPVLEKYYIFLKVYQSSLLNRFRLFIISPLRYLLSLNKKGRRRQLIILKCLLLPLSFKDQELHIIHEIYHSRCRFLYN